MMEKLTSRKFWLSVAAFLGSLAASIAGLVTEEKWITIAGVVCGMLSAAIYAAAEASVDAAHRQFDVEFIDGEDEDDGK
mgnify:CR=1 FL=1